MQSVLITAFEPYGEWNSNSSWLCLQELTRELPADPKLVTRRYPVDFATVRDRLAQDLAANFDLALHLGQAPGAARVRLESVGLNVRAEPDELPDRYSALSEGAPVAYRSTLPLAAWSSRLREAGIPAQVSHHAGTYLCNATLYWSLHLAKEMGLRTEATFVHLPLETSQALVSRPDRPSMPASQMAAALRLLLAEFTARAG